MDKKRQETDQKLPEVVLEGQAIDRRFKHQSDDDPFYSEWGALLESLAQGDLVQLLNTRNIQITYTATNIKREHGPLNERFEFDMLAGNNEEVVVVEVQITLKVKDVDHFLKKLSRFQDFARVYKGKKIYGAIAYTKAEQSSDKNGERRGLFMIHASENSIAVINRKDFQPKVF